MIECANGRWAWVCFFFHLVLCKRGELHNRPPISYGLNLSTLNGTPTIVRHIIFPLTRLFMSFTYVSISFVTRKIVVYIWYLITRGRIARHICQPPLFRQSRKSTRCSNERRKAHQPSRGRTYEILWHMSASGTYERVAA